MTVPTDLAEFAQIIDDSVVPWRVKVKSVLFGLEAGDLLFGRDNDVKAQSSGLLMGVTIDQPGKLSKFLENINILSL